jgi:hypothetical protein
VVFGSINASKGKDVFVLNTDNNLTPNGKKRKNSFHPYSTKGFGKPSKPPKSTKIPCNSYIISQAPPRLRPIVSRIEQIVAATAEAAIQAWRDGCHCFVIESAILRLARSLCAEFSRFLTITTARSMSSCSAHGRVGKEMEVCDECRTSANRTPVHP